jgi:hypothetical protein
MEIPGHVHAGAAEADDVDASVTGDVDEEAGVAVDPPGPGVLVVSETAAHQLGLPETAVALVV